MGEPIPYYKRMYYKRRKPGAGGKKRLVLGFQKRGGEGREKFKRSVALLGSKKRTPATVQFNLEWTKSVTNYGTTASASSRILRHQSAVGTETKE